jgi:histidine triad (HIT) family protein
VADSHNRRHGQQGLLPALIQPKVKGWAQAYAMSTLRPAQTTEKTAVDTLFTKIINREIPAKIIYEDDQVLAFHDIAPQAPVHFLVVPKKPVRTLNDLTEDDKTLAGHILFTAQRLAKELGCEDGFRVVMNCNELGGQTVYHIHMHVLGQRQMHWPPG